MSTPTWILPIENGRIRGGTVRHTFGMVRSHPDGRQKAHQGWDFKARIGTPCRAIGPGLVVAVETRGDYGTQVLVQLDDPAPSGETLWAFYAHLSETHVNAGDRVSRGQVIADTGESGNAEGMAVEDQHLHFELRTRLAPGRGLDDRISPFVLFGHPPY